MAQEDKSKARPTLLLDQETAINGEERFRIMHPIGEVSSGGVQVCKANHTTERGHMKFVVVKYINMDQEPKPFVNLKSELDKNSLLRDHLNFMEIRPPFCCDGHFCVIFPFMEMGSLRTIMANRFPHGVPETCIAQALRVSLRGLSAIHGWCQVHREISAGHIFIDESPAFKLAFAASVYDLYVDAKHGPFPPFLPMNSICKWAAAPEVYYGSGDEYTAKADIWLIGITALELAYGGLRVMNRKQLDYMVMKINQKKRLPRKEEDDSKVKRKSSLWSSCLNLNPSKKRAFSYEFEDMVVRCLDLDPGTRPTADQLLFGYTILAPPNYLEYSYLFNLLVLHK